LEIWKFGNLKISNTDFSCVEVLTLYNRETEEFGRAGANAIFPLPGSRRAVGLSAISFTAIAPPGSIAKTVHRTVS